MFFQPALCFAEGVYDEYLLSPTFWKSSPPQSISKEQALKDVEDAWHILQRGYIGYEIMAERGFNWDDLFKGLEKELRKSPSKIQTKDFFQLLVQGFNDVPDGHFSLMLQSKGQTIKSKRMGFRLYSYVSNESLHKTEQGYEFVSGEYQGYVLLNCGQNAARRLIKPFLNDSMDVELKAVVVSKGPIHHQTCDIVRGSDKKTIKLRFHPARVSERKRQSKPTFSLINGKHNHLKVRSLQASPEMNRFKQTGIELRNEKAIILDMRGNSGGLSELTIEWITNLTSEVIISGYHHQLFSELTLQGDVNTFYPRVHVYEMNPVARKKYRSILNQSEVMLKTQKVMTLGKPFLKLRKLENLSSKRGRATKPFAGKIIVLVDQFCGSACETTLVHLKQLRQVIILGEKTAGMREFGLSRLYPLRNSGILLSVPEIHLGHRNPQYHIKETIGHLPDLWLDTPDSFETTKQLEKCIRNNGCLDYFSKTKDYRLAIAEQNKSGPIDSKIQTTWRYNQFGLEILNHDLTGKKGYYSLDVFFPPDAVIISVMYNNKMKYTKKTVKTNQIKPNVKRFYYSIPGSGDFTLAVSVKEATTKGGYQRAITIPLKNQKQMDRNKVPPAGELQYRSAFYKNRYRILGTDIVEPKNGKYTVDVEAPPGFKLMCYALTPKSIVQKGHYRYSVQGNTYRFTFTRPNDSKQYLGRIYHRKENGKKSILLDFYMR